MDHNTTCIPTCHGHGHGHVVVDLGPSKVGIAVDDPYHSVVQRLVHLV